MKYGFKVYMMDVEDHQFWVAESKELKGCLGQGDTIDEALAELAANEEEWLKTAAELNMRIPEVTVESMEAYSGKFVVRVSPVIHREASECAKKQGISLNQYVNNAILTANVSNAAAEAVDRKLNQLVNEVRNIKRASYRNADMCCEEIFEYHTEK